MKESKIHEDDVQRTENVADKGVVKDESDSEIASNPVRLSASQSANIDYASTPIVGACQEPPRQPSKSIPIVPPGVDQPDKDDSPPLRFNENDKRQSYQDTASSSDAGKESDL